MKKSCMVTAASELSAELTVLRDPLKIPATNNPASPPKWPIVSTTYKGNNCNLKFIFLN